MNAQAAAIAEQAISESRHSIELRTVDGEHFIHQKDNGFWKLYVYDINNVNKEREIHKSYLFDDILASLIRVAKGKEIILYNFQTGETL